MMPYLLILSLFFALENALAIPINTNVALPVAKGHSVFRLQGIAKKTQNSTEVQNLALAIAHGLTKKTVLIAIIP